MFPANMELTLVLALYGCLSYSFAESITYQNLTRANVRVDTGQFGPAVEEIHYYYDQWPIGLAVSKQGRIFVCYTRGNYVCMNRVCPPSATDHSKVFHIGRSY